MSLVNLAHVCSHLQNASLARLGLTSIPYTKLHLSLALLLQKQGFFSSVKLGGPSPPASCFGNGQPNNHHVSNHIHAGRLNSGETALAYKVRKKVGVSELRRVGFRKEAIEFAEQHGNKSRDEMVEMGALDGARRMALSARTELERNIESAIRAEAEEAIKAAEAFIKTLPALGLKSGKSTHEALQRKVQAARESIESLRSASQQALTPEALAELYPHELRTFPVLRALAEQSHEAHPAETLLEAHELEQITEFRSQRHARLRLEFLSRMPGVLRTLVEEMEALELAPEQNNALDHEYSQASLAEFLGPQAILSASRIERNGITLEAMGQMFPNQPITLPREEYLDLEGLDEEGVVTQANRASRRLWLGLKYHESMPVLTKAQLVSKPTKRVWLSSQDLSRVIRGNQAGEVKGMRQIGEVLAVSTDRGMMEARDCVDRQIGGQVLVRVW